MSGQVLFLRILDRSLTASAIILLVLLLRLLFKKAPHIFSYALWAVVLFRLLCPVSFSAPIGLVRESKGLTTYYTSIEATAPSGEHTLEDNIAIEAAFDAPDGDFATQHAPAAKKGENSASVLTDLLLSTASYVWRAGMAGMLLYSVLQYIRLRRRLVGAVPFGENIWRADHIASPFVMGVFRPKIYLPSSLSAGEMPYILAHEQHHIHRGDPFWRLLAYTALCLHWFNPLVWVAFVCSKKDMEMSCDEAVMRKMDTDIRAKYAESLLRFATGKRYSLSAPLPFGEDDTKERIQNVMKYKKPAIWVMILASVLCVVVVTGLAFNAGEDGRIKEDALQDEPTLVPDAVVSWQADLDGDGTPEFIRLDKEELESALVTEPWIASADGTKRCTLRPVAYAHMGWATYALTELDSRTYLFEYNPYVSTGIAGYSYVLWALDGNELTAVETQEVTFSVSSAPSPGNDVDAIVDFVDRVNELWEHSHLLFTTDADLMVDLYLEDGQRLKASSPVICDEDRIVRYEETLKMITDELREAGLYDEESDLKERLELYNELLAQRYQ